MVILEQVGTPRPSRSAWPWASRCPSPRPSAPPSWRGRHPPRSSAGWRAGSPVTDTERAATTPPSPPSASRGYSVTLDADAHARFTRATAAGDGRVASRDDVGALVDELGHQDYLLIDLKTRPAATGSTASPPVFDADGHVSVLLALIGFRGAVTGAEVTTRQSASWSAPPRSPSPSTAGAGGMSGLTPDDLVAIEEIQWPRAALRPRGRPARPRRPRRAVRGRRRRRRSRRRSGGAEGVVHREPPRRRRHDAVRGQPPSSRLDADDHDRQVARGTVYCLGRIQAGPGSPRMIEQAIQYSDRLPVERRRVALVGRVRALLGRRARRAALAQPPAHWPASQVGVGPSPPLRVLAALLGPEGSSGRSFRVHASGPR